MKRAIWPLLTALIISASFKAPNTTALSTIITDTTTPPGAMKQYWLVFLLKGNNRTQDSATAALLQSGHIANIERLAKQGVIIMAGPMGYDKDLRGIFIMDAKDSVTAAGFIKTDPAVIAGRLRFEIHPWWTQKGSYTFK